MTVELTSTGLVTETQEEIGDEIRAELRANVSATMNLEADSFDGEQVEIFAAKIAEVQEAVLALYNELDPVSATGTVLEHHCAGTGTSRRAATRSTVPATVNINPGTYTIGTLVAHVQNDPTARFRNQVAVTNSGGSAADVEVVFEGEDAGPVRANAGTLTVIATPVSGWNSITNAEDADLGLVAESDPELRERRVAELPGLGSTTAAAVAAAVLQAHSDDGVTSALGFENVTDATVDGVPPHSIEILVDGGPGSIDNAIATTIQGSLTSGKAGGIRAYGTTTETVTDSQGFTHTVGFSRPAEVDIYVRFSLEVLAGYDSEANTKTELVDAATAFYTLGYDVVPSKVNDLLHDSVDKVHKVIDLELSLDGVSWDEDATRVIATREKAAFDTARVTITSTTTVTP